MLKRVMTIGALLGLAACSDSTLPQQVNYGTVSSWDKMAYVNPMFKPQWGAMKALEQPGIY
ncbi:MAG: hypothetical protein U1E36_05290 [Rickettsiales bacterium]